jgi:hypothetical protein
MATFFLVSLSSCCTPSYAHKPITAAPNKLRHCTGLQSLDLVFHHDSDIAAGVLRTLPHLSSDDLHTLNLLDNYGVKTHKKWQELDQALTDDGRYAHLRTITLRTASQGLLTDLPKCMPRTLARGVLRVVRITPACA